MRLIFWLSSALMAWTYVLFPLVVLVRGRLARHPVRTAPVTPRVSLIVAAHNEAASIGAKIENLLALDYPGECLEVIVASDGSTDGTDDIVGRSSGPVRLLSLPRVGKAAAMNAAVEVATGEVLVFSDANSMYEHDALQALVAPFADPTVGGVAGDQRYRRGGGDGTSEGERRYWAIERQLKLAESASGNVISATGAIYAVRRSLFEPVPVGVTDDFATSTLVIARGHRLVFAPGAIAWEPVAPSSATEFGRKVRVMTRGLRAVILRRELLDPRRHGFYAVQLASHKLLRRLMVYPSIALGLSSAVLARRGAVYLAAAVAQAAVWLLAAAGLILAGKPLGQRRFLSLPAFVALTHGAALRASWNLVRGHQIDRWDPSARRSPAAPTEAGSAGPSSSLEMVPAESPVESAGVDREIR